MACIKKLEKALAFDCDSGTIGFRDAFFVNMADISSFTIDASNNVKVVLSGSAYKIDTVKKSMTVSETLKVNENAPNAFTHEAVINVFAKGDRIIQNTIRNASVVVFTRSSDDIMRVYGLYYGMKATASAENSHENGGWAQFTLATPEGVIGEDSLTMYYSEYEALYNAAVG